MKLLTDEHISPAVAEALRAKGFDVVSVLEIGLAGLDDRDIWLHAIAEGRIVVTFDLSDFPNLFVEFFFGGIEHPGLAVISSDTIATWDFGAIIAGIEELITRGEEMEGLMQFLQRHVHDGE